MTKFVYTGQDNLEVMKMAHNYNSFLLSLAKKYIPSKDSICIDFGAGTGTFADLLKDNGYTNINCLEPDKEMEGILVSKGYKVYSDLENIKDGTLDVAYLFNVLEHIEKDKEVMQAVSKKLAPGGRLIIYVPAFNHLFTSMDRKVEHHRRYTKNMLEDIISSCKLKTLSNRYYDPSGYFVTLIYKFIGNKNGDLDTKKVVFFDKYIFPFNKLLEPLTNRFFGKNVMIVAEREN